MPIIYPDEDITKLVREQKSAPSDWATKIRLKSKPGHAERHIDLNGCDGNKFRLIFRQSNTNFQDFSIVLAVHVPLSNQLFRLRRYNGKSHEHTNHIENETFFDFHIHIATERYQALGTREDAYAVITDRYGDFHGALRCLIDDANLAVPEMYPIDSKLLQQTLF